MENLFRAVCIISAELNEISKESSLSEIGNLKYRGDNANFSISIFQEYFINQWEKNELNELYSDMGYIKHKIQI